MSLRVHLVDGTYELFRAHFSKRPPRRDAAGKDIKAAWGVKQSMEALLKDRAEAVTHLAIAFDNPIRSFRNALFAGYKTEEGVPPELLAQFDDVERLVADLGLTVWSMKDFEADDALATGAAVFAKNKRVDQVRILTPDKDLGQCLLGERVVQVDRMRERTITEDSFRADKGFSPHSIPDYLALVGDSADGIPGIDGWGEKGTAAVLSVYPHLEDIPDDESVWKVIPRGAARLAENLRTHRKEATLYRTLATVRTDAPIDTKLEALTVPSGRTS